jgi:hypothetical protein
MLYLMIKASVAGGNVEYRKVISIHHLSENVGFVPLCSLFNSLGMRSQ